MCPSWNPQPKGVGLTSVHSKFCVFARVKDKALNNIMMVILVLQKWIGQSQVRGAFGTHRGHQSRHNMFDLGS